jgi:hypothetical protein
MRRCTAPVTAGVICRGHRHCLPAASHQVPSTPASRPRPCPHPGHQPIRSLCWTWFAVRTVPAGGQHLAATVSQGGQLADPFGIAVESNGAILVADVVHNLRRPCGHPVNKRGCVSEGSWPARTRLSFEFAAASAITAEPAVPDHPQRWCGTGGGASRHLEGSAGRRRRDKLNGWAARAATGAAQRGPRSPGSGHLVPGRPTRRTPVRAKSDLDGKSRDESLEREPGTHKTPAGSTTAVQR